MWQDGAVTGVLAGARDRKNMQAFIDSGSFGGQGVSCIIDQEGQVLISPCLLYTSYKIKRLLD